MSDNRITQLNIPEGMIDFGVGQPPLSLLPLDEVKRAADHRLGQGNAEMLAYGLEQGDGPFRSALAGFLAKRYKLPVSAEHLMVTCGASQSLDLICTRFTVPGDTIFVEEPTYFLALVIFRDHGLNVVGIPVDANGLRMDALEAALKEHRPKFVYTIPTFQNPSGSTLPLERRNHLLQLSAQHDFLVVADEVYHLLDFGEAPPRPLASYSDTGRVLSLGSFSKITAPGLRMGWIQASPALLEVLILSGLLDSSGGLNPFTSAVMTSMIELGSQDAVLDRFREVYSERSKALSSALREHLPTCSFVEPRGGFFIWVQLPEGVVVSDFYAKAKQLGVGFQPGTNFASGGRLSNYIRLSFAHYEIADLVEGVKRLANALSTKS